MKSYLARWFPSLFGYKTGGIEGDPPTPQIVKHVTVVEVRFTDLTSVPIYRVLKRKGSGFVGWDIHGYTDRVDDTLEFSGDSGYRVDVVWGYRAPGDGPNNLFMLNKIEAVPRLPVLAE